MWPFKRNKRKRFVIKMKEDQLVNTIIDLLTTNYSFSIERIMDKLIILTDADPFKVQERVLKWFTPERIYRLQVELYCNCAEYSKDKRRFTTNPDCPIHGVPNQIEEMSRL